MGPQLTFHCFLYIVLGCASIDSAVKDDFVYRSYQETIYCNPSTRIKTPRDEHALSCIIQKAIKNGQTVKAFGSRHSITDIICTNGVPISMKKINYARLNDDTTATFGAGIKLVDALSFLESKGRSLLTVPTFAGISIGGALGTGAHGSSLRHPTSISDQVIRMNVILGNGSKVEISESELDIFRVHLGLLGVVIDVTLQTVPLFKMTVENSATDDSGLFDGLIVAEAYNHDFYQVWWFPQSSSIVKGIGDNVATEGDTPGNAFTNFIPSEAYAAITQGHDTYETAQANEDLNTLNYLAEYTEAGLYTQVPGKPPIFTENGTDFVNPATGYAWRLQSNLCNKGCTTGCAWFNGNNSVFPEESSMAFDISRFTDVMNMMKNITEAYPASFPMVGVYIRFAMASPALMAISNARTTFTIEWTTPRRQDPFNTARTGIATYQAILQEMVANYGGRPHWGKNGLYYTSNSFLQSQMVPNWQLFVNAMKKYDPYGILLNAFGNRMLGKSNAQDRDPRVKHCALQDYCTCMRDDDCASGQHCDQINAFPVCRDN